MESVCVESVYSQLQQLLTIRVHSTPTSKALSATLGPVNSNTPARQTRWSTPDPAGGGALALTESLAADGG